MRPLRTLLIAFLVVAAIAGIEATPASAATSIAKLSISKVQFDSPGTDSGSDASLNAEYVRITNDGKTSVDMYGYTLSDNAKHRYNFLKHYVLKPGARVYVHTGRGFYQKPDAQHVYWDHDGYVWNNGGDTATLRNKDVKTVDSCKWTKKGTGYTYC
jgi:hypothetical protein